MMLGEAPIYFYRNAIKILLAVGELVNSIGFTFILTMGKLQSTCTCIHID